MAKKSKKAFPFSWRQLVYVLVLALAISYLVAVFDAVRRGREAQALVEQMEAEIADLQSEQVALQDELAYVQSDTYVEQAAKTELKWSDDGENVVVPVEVEKTPTATTVIMPAPLSTDQVSPKSRWDEFLNLFRKQSSR